MPNALIFPQQRPRPNYMGSIVQGMALPQMITQMQTQGAQNALLQNQLSQQEARQNALQGVSSMEDLNNPEVMKRIMAADPEFGLKAAQQLRLMDEVKRKTVMDNFNQAVKIIQDFAPAIKSPEDYARFKQLVTPLGLGDLLPAEYNPQLVNDLSKIGQKFTTVIGPEGAMKVPGDVKFDPRLKAREPKEYQPRRYLPKEGEGPGIWLQPGVEPPAGYIPEQQKISSGSELDLTPDAIEQMARRYILDGTMPGLGLGKAATKARSLVMNKVPEIMAAEGLTPQGAVANKMVLGGLKSEATRLLGQRGPMLAFAKTADENLNLASRLSEKVGRTGVPVFNRWLLAGRKSIAGDPDVASFDAAVRVAINEFAKVTSSATGGGVTSDTARKEIEQTLNTAQTLEQFRAVTDTLKQDMDNRVKGYDYQLKNIQDAMKGIGTPGTGGGTTQEKQSLGGHPPYLAADNPNARATGPDGSIWVSDGKKWNKIK